MDLCCYNDRSNQVLPPKLRRNDIVLDSKKQDMENHYLKFMNSSKEEIDLCLQLIYDNYSIVTYCFQDLQAQSYLSYPLINSTHVFDLFSKVLNETSENVQEQLAQIDVTRD